MTIFNRKIKSAGPQHPHLELAFDRLEPAERARAVDIYNRESPEAGMGLTPAFDEHLLREHLASIRMTATEERQFAYRAIKEATSVRR